MSFFVVMLDERKRGMCQWILITLSACLCLLPPLPPPIHPSIYVFIYAFIDAIAKGGIPRNLSWLGCKGHRMIQWLVKPVKLELCSLQRLPCLWVLKRPCGSRKALLHSSSACWHSQLSGKPGESLLDGSWWGCGLWRHEDHTHLKKKKKSQNLPLILKGMHNPSN